MELYALGDNLILCGTRSSAQRTFMDSSGDFHDIFEKQRKTIPFVMFMQICHSDHNINRMQN